MASPQAPSNPMRHPELWDRARIGGIVTPGQVEITGGVSARKWDVWGGFGLVVGATVFTGIDPHDFGMRIKIWEPEQYDDFIAQLGPLLELPLNQATNTLVRPKALSFFHPAVSLPPLKIRGVGVKEVSQWQQDDLGLWWIDIKLIPYFTPKPHVAKPIAADDTKPKPQDKLEEEILALTGEIQKYAKP